MGTDLTRQWIAALSCTLSVAIGGTGFAWMAPLMVEFVGKNSPIPMTKDDTSWLSSTLELGQVIATMPACILADMIGRKFTILCIGPLSLIAWILVASTRSKIMLYIVRCIQGIVTAIVFTIVPMYLAEISEPIYRGMLCGQLRVMWYLGILYAYCFGPYLLYKYYAIICGIVPIIFTIIFSFVPETPYFLYMSNNEVGAYKSLKWLRGSNYGFETELESIKHSVDQDMKKKATWKDLFATRKDVYVFCLVQVVLLTKMLTGLSAIIMYATQTFSEEFSGSISSASLTIIFGIALLLTSFSASFFADRVGRRPLLILSSAGSAFCHLITALICYLDNNTNIDISSFKWISYVTIIGFCIVTNVGIASLVTTIQAEYFPSHTRALGSGVTEILAAAAGFISIKQYQLVNDVFGVYMNFFIFFIIACIATAILIKVIPETASKSLGQIQSSFDKNHEETAML